MKQSSRYLSPSCEWCAGHHRLPQTAVSCSFFKVNRVYCILAVARQSKAAQSLQSSPYRLPASPVQSSVRKAIRSTFSRTDAGLESPAEFHIEQDRLFRTALGRSKFVTATPEANAAVAPAARGLRPVSSSGRGGLPVVTHSRTTPKKERPSSSSGTRRSASPGREGRGDRAAIQSGPDAVSPTKLTAVLAGDVHAGRHPGYIRASDPSYEEAKANLRLCVLGDVTLRPTSTSWVV